MSSLLDEHPKVPTILSGQPTPSVPCQQMTAVSFLAKGLAGVIGLARAPVRVKKPTVT